MIGIFWVYKGTVFGKAIEVNEGEEGVPGVVDSPDNHTDYWDNEKAYLRLFPELRFREYLQVPRGRVLYFKDDQRAVVYMDKALFTDSIKQLVLEFFRLKGEAIAWRTDPHYTTSSAEIDHLLE